MAATKGRWTLMFDHTIATPTRSVMRITLGEGDLYVKATSKDGERLEVLIGHMLGGELMIERDGVEFSSADDVLNRINGTARTDEKISMWARGVVQVGTGRKLKRKSR